MKNFSFNHEGQEYWYSRSVVCTNYIFCKYCNVWWVLAARRGDSQTSPRKWNVPGGFLDHDETFKDCAIRETFEETGVDVSDHTLQLYNIDDALLHGRQHIVVSFYTNLGKVDNLPTVSNKNNEPDETGHISWIPIVDLRLYRWIPNQSSSILNIFNHHIKHASFTYWLKDKLVKWISKL